MAKGDSKPVSFRLRNPVVWALEDLVSAWGCTQTGAVERAISEAHQRVFGRVTPILDQERFEAQHSAAAQAIEQAHPRAVREARQEVYEGESDPTEIPGIQVGAVNLPKNAFCKHCGKKFAGPKWATLCPECAQSGHQGMPAECAACNEGRGI